MFTKNADFNELIYDEIFRKITDNIEHSYFIPSSLQFRFYEIFDGYDIDEMKIYIRSFEPFNLTVSFCLPEVDIFIKAVYDLVDFEPHKIVTGALLEASIRTDYSKEKPTEKEENLGFAYCWNNELTSI